MVVKSMELAWVVVSDFAKAKKFFTESVGLKVSSSNDEFGWAELCGKDGGALLGIATAGKHSPVGPGQNAIVTLTVDDIVKAKAQLVKKGVKMLGDIIEVPGIVKMQLFEDLDGNKFQLVEDIEKK